MKKFFLVVAVALLSVSASAQSSPIGDSSQNQVFAPSSSEGLPPPIYSELVRPKGFKTAFKGNKPHKFPSEADLITEQPAGTVMDDLYNGSVAYYETYDFWSGSFVVIVSTCEGAVTKMVKGDDGAYYLYDPFVEQKTDSWLKLDDMGDGRLVAHLPQAIYIPGEGYSDRELRYAFHFKEKDGWFYEDRELPDVEFVLRNDSLIQITPGMIGAAKETGDWDKFGVTNLVVRKVNEAKTTPSVGLEMEKFKCITGTGGEIIDCAVNESEIYFKGLFKALPDAYFKGVIKGDKVIFTSGQYLGIAPANAVTDRLMHMYFMAGNVSKQWNAQQEQNEDVYSLEKEMACDYDAANRTITFKDSTFINMNCGMLFYDNSFRFNEPEISPFVEIAGIPQTPVFTSVEQFYESLGCGFINVNIPLFDTNGNFMDCNKMYYNMFVDGELYTFYNDEYTELPQAEMTDIPFTLKAGWAISGGTTPVHSLDYYFKDFETIGIQSIYTGGGETNKSEIAIAFNPVGIKGVADPGVKVKSMEYTDMAGRKVANPQKGVYVVTVTYENGTKVNKKMSVR